METLYKYRGFALVTDWNTFRIIDDGRIHLETNNYQEAVVIYFEDLQTQALKAVKAKYLQKQQEAKRYAISEYVGAVAQESIFD